MRNNPPDNDPQTIWQNQITEKVNMSATQFMEKAEQLRARSRWMAIANDVTHAAAVVFIGFLYAQTTNTMSRAGLILLAAGVLYVAFQAHKRLWPQASAPDSPPYSGLVAYRYELQRSRDHARNIWPMVAPIIPGAILYALPVIVPLVRNILANPAILMNAVPLCVLFAIWLVIMFPRRKRKLRKIQSEIDMVNRLAGSTPH